MTGRGRPFRFLAVVLLGWTGLRVALLWPRIDSVPTLIDAIVPGAVAREEATPPPPVQARINTVPPSSVAATVVAIEPKFVDRSHEAITASDPARESVQPSQASTLPSEQVRDPGVQAGVPRPLPAATPSVSHWSGSAWLLVRGGGSGIASGLVGGQLGGSQAGVRVAYALDDRGRLAIAGRLTTPLGRGLREAALGVEWQPTRAPLRVVAEYRVPLGEGRGGPAAGIVGGFGPVAVAGLVTDGYGQAGVIDRGRTEAFVDGAVHLRKPLASLGAVDLDVGGAVWGAAQRGAGRLDLGPSLGAVVPIGPQRVRLSLDWRERVAGDARPGSGVALTLGADF